MPHAASLRCDKADFSPAVASHDFLFDAPANGGLNTSGGRLLLRNENQPTQEASPVEFRTIKPTLEMDVLRCKSQPMVEIEIAAYFMA